MFVNGDYENLWQQMGEEFLDHFPSKGAPRVMTKEELEDYLIDLKFRDFIGR